MILVLLNLGRWCTFGAGTDLVIVLADIIIITLYPPLLLPFPPLWCRKTGTGWHYPVLCVVQN